jgi:hypothetical protein
MFGYRIRKPDLSLNSLESFKDFVAVNMILSGVICLVVHAVQKTIELYHS